MPKERAEGEGEEEEGKVRLEVNSGRTHEADSTLKRTSGGRAMRV